MGTEANEIATFARLLQSTVCESPFMRQLANVWSEIGIDEEQRQKRRELMLMHITNLMEEMAAEELTLKSKLEESLQTNIRELSELYIQLSRSVEPVPVEMSLYARESLVRSRVDALNKMKFERQKRMKRLIEMETAFCSRVGETVQLKDKYKPDFVPSEEELMAFRKRVEDIEFIMNERRGVYHDLCSKVHKIWEDLEEEPHGYFATVCEKGGDNAYAPVLTKDEMEKMEAAYKQIVTDAAHLEDKAQELRQKISSLWTRLDIPQDDQLTFNEISQGHKPRVIKALEAELSRLTEMKQANMKRLIHNTRVELHKVWDKCLYGEKQRQEFAPAFTDDYTDDVLGDLESELDRVEGFYRDNVSIFEKVAKRELKWSQYMEYVEKDNDPTRLFTARGGQLLKDQQTKKQLQKDLFKLEKGLKAELKQWEEDCERYFIVHDDRYLDTIQTQWEETDKQKQKEKIKRQKEKEETTMIEMTYGSKPTTPIKKIMKRPAASPLTVPAKMRKVGQSPCVKSTLSNSAAASRPPRSTRTIRNAKKRAQESKARRILKERNAPATTDTMTSESFFSQANASLASTGTYTDFRCGLDTNQNLRSSVIPKTSSINQLS